MKTIYKGLLFFLLFSLSLRSQNDSIMIYYYENYPYAYTEKVSENTKNGIARGLEIEIIEEYIIWLKKRKNIDAKVGYWLYTDFSEFYGAIKSAKPNVIGLGSVTRNLEREKELSFSPPYLINQAVLVTNGNVFSIREKTSEGIKKILGDMTALTVANSSHENYLKELKTTYSQNFKINYVLTPKGVLDSISINKKVFGYSDIISYWSYLKTNPSKVLKMQKALSGIAEELCYILPKTNQNSLYLNEFFESGFGFTSTKVYHQILEDYLGREIIEYVEVK